MNYYCIPKDEFEWRDILLKCGCSKETLWMYPYSRNDRVWYNEGGVCPMFSSVAEREAEYISAERFLEKYRTDKPKYVDPQLSLKGRVRELELKNDLFVSIIDRLTKLEDLVMNPLQ